MTTVKLAYAEYENGEPPWAWLDGQQLEHADQFRIHRLLARLDSSTVRTVNGSYGRAARVGGNLVLSTTVGIEHVSGAKQGVVVGLTLENTPAGWAKAAAQIGHILADAGIRVDESRLRTALAASWADLTRPWISHVVRSTFRWFVRWKLSKARRRERAKSVGG